MPKLKTNKAASKRYKVLASGKVVVLSFLKLMPDHAVVKSNRHEVY